jgi:hypothetical protein
MNKEIIKYLESLKKTSEEKGKDKLVNTYKKAINSITKYPLELKNGSEAKILGKINLNL